MRIGEFETHPLADRFPLVQGPEYEQMVESMRSRGFDASDPVVRVYDPTAPTKRLILDGRNRLRAALEAGQKPKFSDHALLEDGTAQGLGNLRTYVVARNLARRHLSTSQRGVIAAELATLEPGRPKKTPSREGVSRADAAQQLGISVATVERAAEVIRKADPEVVETVRSGGLSVAGAAKVAKLPVPVQRQVVEEIKAEAAKSGKEVDGGKVATLVKKAERRQTAERIEAEPPPMPLGPFRAIAIDYAWPYDSRADDMTQRGKLGYPAMSLEAIEAHMTNEVDRLVHSEGSVLFFWVTNEFVEEGHAIVRRAGWRKRAFITWDKVLIGLGNTYRNVTEHCIVATKGDAAIHVTSQSTLIREPRREHSRKPEAFYLLVEETVPGSRVELFARTQRVGWTCWGAEVGKFAPVLDVSDLSSDKASPPAPRGGTEGHEPLGQSEARNRPGDLLDAPRAAETAARDLCIDCEHPACPGEPDCSACPDCTRGPSAARAVELPEGVSAEVSGSGPAAAALREVLGASEPTGDPDTTTTAKPSRAVEAALGDDDDVSDEEAAAVHEEVATIEAEDADIEAFDRALVDLVRARADVRVKIGELSAAQAHHIKAEPTDRWWVCIEHGTGSSTGMVAGPTRAEALAAARTRLEAPHAKHSKKTLELGAELRRIERVIEGWCATHGGAGAVHVLPDRSFDVELSSQSGRARGRAFAKQADDAFRIAAEKHNQALERAAKRSAAKKPGKRGKPT